ncbi:MAG: sigma-70 family RNA polymerase sigma factor [Saprospiraceae bacterium]|nr:sigma-70 family RNA polymerase sigma factor [Saprospiraceae bacterium]MBK8848904.1 sigma-70 family RNA polymerase sigma factor [Saprospiraceae bacterium]MBL0084246.1 sigma-70 family RNA polymerase sigma factor [Saprospiraceae bacterium]HMS97168.1 sigma-70 family RNA polymerase sigma factor [Saprospiraceae bacterium]HRG20912.1 sigma-70 family RNA polymerase sigma factor [Saprospiraceae bacterium]
MIDQTFILKIKEKDPRAFQLLYESYAPYVYAIVKNYVFDESYRKDAMQEVFAAIFTSIKNYDAGKAEFKTWVGRVTVNQSISFLRKTYKHKLNFNLELYSEVSETETSRFHELSREELEKLLHKMPLGYRTVFLLYVIDEYDHKEIAAMLDITQETSRSQLMRALSWIRSHIFSQDNVLRYEFR